MQSEKHAIKHSSTKSCPVTAEDKQKAWELLSRYSPSLHTYCFENPERCVKGETPTLGEIKKRYGEELSIYWLKLEINDYLNFLGIKEDNKLVPENINELSKLILARFYYLKLSELLLFFCKLKYGDYGEVFGRVDPLRILNALKSFVEYRNTIISRLEQEERQRKMEEDSKNAVSYSEYLKSKSNKTVVL